jgi:uncharacterized membrane protein required for colicin V production
MLGVTLTSGTINWYDVVVVGALFYGVWSGIRAGLTGEIIRVIGLVTMLVLAVEFHQSVGDWLSANSPLPDDGCQLIAFVSIAVVVYLITLWIRLATRKRMQELKTAALVENVGGGFAGAVRMVLIMAWVTVVLSLSTSNFLYDQVGVKSRFGSLVLDQFPAARAAMQKNSAGKSWFSQDVKRRSEPNYEVGGPTNAQPLETITK